jgi:hypothetical protein
MYACVRLGYNHRDGYENIELNYLTYLRWTHDITIPGCVSL